MEMNIEPGSYLHGLRLSDFDNLLLYHYQDLEKEFAKFIEEEQSDETKEFIDLFQNQLRTKIADNERIIRELEIEIANEKIEQGFVSANLIRLNNLKSVDEKADCFIEYLNFLKKDKPQKTKSEVIKEALTKYGFFELPTVKQLSNEGKAKLIDLISSKGLPYSIAMFNYLGFLTYLDRNHFRVYYKRNIEISKWFNSDKDGRAVKGNISSLLNQSKGKSRYTAHIHKYIVQKDYQGLK